MIFETDHAPGRTVQIDGNSLLYFGGTSYLGMGTDKRFIELYKSKLAQYGAFYGASRQGNVRMRIYDKAERFLTEWCGAEDAVLCSSGYLAGQLCISPFTSPGYRILVSPYCHAAARPQNAHHFESFSSLGQYLGEILNSGKMAPIPVIISDAVNSNGEGVDILDSLKKLPLERCILVIDDSHAIGITGENGSGSFRKLAKLKTRELLVCCSLGKALGIGAGVILGRKDRISTYRQAPIYAGASPPSPSAIATFLDAQDIYRTAREVLDDHMQIFYSTLYGNSFITAMESLPYAGITSTPLIKFLQTNAILVSSFKYSADPTGTPGRIVLSAAHQKNDLKQLINVIKQFNNT